MANHSLTPESSPAGMSGGVKFADMEPPPSLPLQIFLFCAFLVTVAAYVASQRAESRAPTEPVLMNNIRLHRLFQEKIKYESYTKSGFQEEDKKNLASAVSNFQDAIIIKNTGEAHTHLGQALLLQSKTNDACREFKAAISLDPRLRDVYAILGDTLVKLGKLDEAEQVFRQAAERNPAYSPAHFKLAAVLAAEKKNLPSLEEFNKAAKLGLDDPDFWLQFGLLDLQSGHDAQAETHLAKAAALKADLPGVQFQLALAQQHQGKLADAIGHYETMLNQSPDHAETLNNLALIYATASATNAALRSPKMAVSLATRASAAANDKNARYMDTLARSYAADGEFLQAEVWENKAMEQAKQNGDGDLLAACGRRYALFQQRKAE